MNARTRHWLVLAAIWTLPSAFFLVLSWSVYARFHVAAPAGLSPDARAEALRVLREAVDSAASGPDGGDAAGDVSVNATRPSHPALERGLDGRGPIIVTVWRAGAVLARVEGRGATVADALARAAAALRAHPTLQRTPPRARLQARIKVDIVSERGRIWDDGSLLRALSLNPGLDGLAVRLDTSLDTGLSDDGGEAREAAFWLLPDELIAHRLFGRSTPLHFVPDFKIGLDFPRADKLLAKSAEAAGVKRARYEQARKHYFRFRAVSFIERPYGRGDRRVPLELERGLTVEHPEPTAENLRDAATAGARYLVAHLAQNGRYIYERDLFTGRGTGAEPGGPYSIPRHAGTTYYLAELYRITGQEFLREPIERAFAHLSELIEAGGCHGVLPDGPNQGAAFGCVLDKGRSQAHLGSTALTVVALVEYRRATGDTRYDTMARELSEWILYMQRPDGSFDHVYDIRTREKLDQELLYYSGESALAMARMYTSFGEERYLDATERALDDLIGWYDEFFVGGFFFGEEHWTCLAAEAIHPALDHRRYLDFCLDYARFLRDQQVVAGEFTDQAQYVGSYNVTPVIVPQNTPAGSKTESMISAYLLARAHGVEAPALRAQVVAALDYSLGQQIRPENGYFVSGRIRGMGGVGATPADWSVRIDYVQHVCSAFIRGIDVLVGERDEETGAQTLEKL